MVFGRGDGGCLVARPCLTFNAKDNLQANWIENTHGVRLAPTTHFLPTGEAFAIAAQIGLGWGIMPEPLARAPITSGALVSLVTDTDLDVEFEWQVSRVMAPALASLTSAIRLAARQELISS